MWSGNRPPYYDQSGNPQADGIPVLRHHGDPPVQPQGQPVPPYGYPQPPAPGFVTAYPPAAPLPAGAAGYTFVPQAYPGMAGEEEWLPVHHGAPFPFGLRLVQAMDRQLHNNDNTAKDSYVALWTNNGEPVFGRAWNNSGKVEAWFPYGGKEHHSGGISSFQLLTYYGPPKQHFRYAWVPVNQLNAMCQPVRRGDYSPAVMAGVQVGRFDGEMLGKCNIARGLAWISHNGKEHKLEGDVVSKAHVLCRVPL